MEKAEILKSKIFEFCKKYTEQLTIIGLGIFLYFLYFHNLGTYSLMDVDETRYVAMAKDMFHTKDFMTLYLNGQYFFEKPPLYFWQECLSFAFWGGKVSEFTARFPVALLGFIFSFVVYFSTKKWVNRRFGIFSTLILATSLEFVILAKYAILDIVLTFYIGLALVSYFSVFFCKEKNKKYFWWAFYIFSGLAVMAKGIPGVAVPFGTVFFTSIMAKKFKEIFKPIFIIPGMILFLLVVLPWHLLMFKIHDPLFFNEYIIKHHLERFINSHDIGRKQPFYYFFLVILWGFIPWTFSMLSIFISKLKNLGNVQIKQKIKEFDFYKLDNVHKLVALCWVCLGWIMLFYSSSSTKLATYILPVYFPMAVITGLYWKDFVEQKKYEKPINISVQIVGWIFTIAGIVAIFSPLFLPQQINQDIANVRWFTIICLLVLGIGSLLCVKYKKYMGIFALYVLFITVISAFGMGGYFNVDYSFGQKDLVEFAKFSQDHNYTISANGMDRKYSLLYYNDEKVDYNVDDCNIDEIRKDLEKKNNVVIVKNKVFDEVKNNLKFVEIKKGRRYTMIKGNK